MSASIGVILACVLAGLAALVGMGIHALRHGGRRIWGWICLPLGAILMIAFVPAIIGHAERVWTAASPALWLLILLGAAGLLLQVLGWRAVFQPPLRPSQCPECGYERAGLARCPECGAERGEA